MPGADARDRAILSKVEKTLCEQGYIVEHISIRNGFNILLVETPDNRRYMVWVRLRPIDARTLKILERYTGRYTDIDGRILLKLTKKADFVRVKGWTKVYSIEDLLAHLSQPAAQETQQEPAGEPEQKQEETPVG